ncbi:MAG: hypothetical protein NE330_16680, partial [Lentisphaeraceae bacterium]|nr:hypothetical protein [Lentisphaeraceae bacterium]
MKIDSPLPDRYMAFDLLPENGSGLLRVCLVADTHENSPVELFSSSLSTVFLGVVVDGENVVRQKLEIVVENRYNLVGSFDERYASLTNETLDKQWDGFAAAFSASPKMIFSPQVSKPATPLVLDFESGKSSYLLDAESAEKWQLCQEDHLLKEAGLSAYSSSLTRFLHVPENPGAGFVNVENGGENSQVKSIDSLISLSDERKIFNKQAGRFIILNRKDLTLAEYNALLNDLPLNDDDVQPESIESDEKFQGAGGLNGRLFTGHHSTQVNYSEILHLKLSALADLSSHVQSAIDASSVPMFNISDESFAVNISPQGKG